MSEYLIIGRALAEECGFYEYRWRDSKGTLPSDSERHQLMFAMSNNFQEVFHRNPERTAVVVLPSVGEKLYKYPTWAETLDSTNPDAYRVGSSGLHVEDNWEDPTESTEGA